MSLMDFDQSGVRLLQFTPLFTDAYTPHSYPHAQCMDTTPSSAHINTTMNEDMIMAVSSPTPMHQPPPYCDESSVYAANEPNPSTIYSAAIDGQQSYNQALSPAVSLPASYHDDPLDFESLDRILSGGDLGPHPVRIPRLDEEPPRNKETAFTSPQTSWLASPGSSHSNPHSPQDMRQRTLLQGASKTRASRQSTKSPRNLVKLRATSPVFPDQSTPLSSVNSLSRHPSLTSLSCSSTMSDPFTTASVAAQSDPGPRASNRELYNYRAECKTAIDSAIHSPSMSSLQDSPSFLFSGSEASSPQLSSRTCMELEMPQKYVRKITDLDRRILKLQAERAKVLEKAHQTNPAGTGPKAVVGRTNVDGWLLQNDVRETEMCSVPLYIFPLGIQDLDDPLYEAANSILRHVGGLYFDLKSSIGSLRNICCKGVSVRTEISTCFAYIKSLLCENQKLKLSNSNSEAVTTDTKSYRIQVITETAGTVDGNELGSIDESQSQEFITALSAANDVLGCALRISNSYSSVHVELQQVREMATKKASDFEIACNKHGVVDRERRNQLKSVLEGNCTTIASAQRVWPQYYEVATETIRTITECIHPTS